MFLSLIATPANSTAPQAAPSPFSDPLFLPVLLVSGLLIYGILRGIEVFIVAAKRKGRVPIVWLDADSRSLKLAWEKRSKNRSNELDLPEAQPILEGEAAWQSPWGLAWIMHKRHGWNYTLDKKTVPEGDSLVTAKTDKEEITTRLRAVLAVSNPASYHHAITMNEARDALEANKEDQPWYVAFAPVAMIAIILILLIVGFIAYKVAAPHFGGS